jgi:hypothetical protein
MSSFLNETHKHIFLLQPCLHFQTKHTNTYVPIIHILSEILHNGIAFSPKKSYTLKGFELMIFCS